MKRLIAKFADKTFVRFVLVGVINTLFGSAIMFVFYNVFHLSYWLSSASNYFFGSILSYFLNKYYTFRYKSAIGRSSRALRRIFACAILCPTVLQSRSCRRFCLAFPLPSAKTEQCSAACAFSSRSTTSASAFSRLKMKTVNKIAFHIGTQFLSRHYCRIKLRPGEGSGRFYFKGHKSAGGRIGKSDAV